jgi:mannose-6-phosphate isomerase-like protein (cupin superfamily)
MNSKIKISTGEALQELRHSNKEFISLFVHGTLEVKIYKPDKIDNQKPHDKDEVYVIVSGSGDFYCNGETISFKSGDFLFVPAHADHWFLNFTDDFSTWVVFYGKNGGEVAR